MFFSKTALCVLAICCLINASFSEAGCYPNGKRPDRNSVRSRHPDEARAKQVELNSDLPKEFDWSNVDGKNYLTPSWNQHIPVYCGSCWIHGSLHVVQDRLKVNKLGVGNDIILSRQEFLNCAKVRGHGNGCGGGEATDVYSYMKKYGVPDNTCSIYKAQESGKCEEEDVCSNCMPVGGKHICWPIKSFTRYFVTDYGKITGGEQAIMSEIHARGPVVCSLATTHHFDYEYRGGVYIDKTNATDVNHDVEVVGWGEDDDGTKYWRIRNSWGTYWGEEGFFKLIRGEGSEGRDLKITEDCWFALVDNEEEKQVMRGEKVGSMYGLVDKKKQRHGQLPNTKEKTTLADKRTLPALAEPNKNTSGGGFSLLGVFTALACGFAVGGVVAMTVLKKKSANYQPLS
eukprot:Nk52_evm12s228 gene=Nk52_evmTU12s228